MAHDVFICHAHEDYVTALAACAKLEEAHVRCWIAPRDVGPGAYAKQLVQAIGGASAVLLVFSQRANASENVLRELEIASNRQKVIIPFKIENVPPNEDLEYFTLRVHWLDALNPPLEHRLDELVAFVQRLLAAQPVLSPPPAEPATPDARKEPETVLISPPQSASPGGSAERTVDDGRGPAPASTVAPTVASPQTRPGFPRTVAALLAAVVLALGAGSYVLTHRAKPAVVVMPQPTVMPAPTPFVPARAGAAIPAGFVEMYDRLPGVFSKITSCTQTGAAARVGVQLLNDYRGSLNADLALTKRADHPSPSNWFPRREHLRIGLSAPRIGTVAGYTCGVGDLYAGLRHVRFGRDKGPYVVF